MARQVYPWRSREGSRAPQRTGLLVDPATLETYSRLLVDPEVQYEFLVNGQTVTVTSIELRGEGAREELKRLLETLSKLIDRDGVYYVSMLGDGASVKALVAQGRLIGLAVEVEGEQYTGVEAAEALGRLRGRMTVTITRVNTRIAEWRPEYSVYVRSMDEQHKRFFEILNRLFESLVTGRIEDEGEVILRGLEDYTRAHFRSEEVIMERYGYPEKELEAHRREHRRFTQIVQDYREKYEANPAAIGMPMFYVVKSWFTDHILGTDKRYGEYFKRLGIKVE